jgi:hypothetical protein
MVPRNLVGASDSNTLFIAAGSDLSSRYDEELGKVAIMHNERDINGLPSSAFQLALAPFS